MVLSGPAQRSNPSGILVRKRRKNWLVSALTKCADTLVDANLSQLRPPKAGVKEEEGGIEEEEDEEEEEEEEEKNPSISQLPPR